MADFINAGKVTKRVDKPVLYKSAKKLGHRQVGCATRSRMLADAPRREQLQPCKRKEKEKERKGRERERGGNYLESGCFFDFDNFFFSYFFFLMFRRNRYFEYYFYPR